jgi:transcriptional regulator with XRE-family HTH domain
LTRLRLKRLLSRTPLTDRANELGISPTTLSRWERGTKKKPSGVVREKIERFYGESVDSLFRPVRHENT